MCGFILCSIDAGIPWSTSIWFSGNHAQEPLTQWWFDFGPASHNDHWPNAGIKLGLRLRRWINIISEMCQRAFSLGMEPSTAGVESTSYPGKHEPWPNAGVMLGQRLTRWNNITSALGQHSCLPGESSRSITADPFTDNPWKSTWYSGYLRIKPDLSGSIVMAFDLFDHNLLQTRGVDPMLNKAGTAAQHCTTLHRNAMQCNAMQCNAMQCNALHNRIAIGSHCKTNRFYYTTTTTTDSLLTIFN